MEEVRVESWVDLQEELFVGEWYAYRGVPDANHDRLKPSLVRLGGDPEEVERHLLRNFRKYARQEVDSESVWHWLSVAQHHGLPTRLLDWTYSPLVAAHFATADLPNPDSLQPGLVWKVDAREVNRRLPRPLRKGLDREGANVFTTEMLDDVAGSLDDLNGFGDDPFPLFFEPPSLDQRIVNQYALSSLASDPTLLLDEWLEDQRDLARKVVIPADVKWEVRNNLDRANVNERVLFPGLDGLADWLTRYYHPDRPR